MITRTILRATGRCLALSLVAAACGGCLTDPRMAVRPYWGAGMEFSGYGPTFDWAPGARESGDDLNAPNAHKHVLVQEMIQAGFESKGYELSSSHPDFWIQYDIWKTRVGNELGYKNYIDKGGLIIEVIDPESKLLIWRCTAQSRILTSDPPAVWQDKAQNTVDGIMKTFPAAGRIDLQQPKDDPNLPEEESPEIEPLDAKTQDAMTAAKEKAEQETPETFELFDE